MREILFRGKSCYSNRWAEGYFSMMVVGVPCIQLLESHNNFHEEVVEECAVILDTVGQYTGLKDRNGNKIFEGDILSAHFDDAFPEEETRGCVCWNDYGWHIKIGAHLDTLEQDWVSYFFEVIGNIYDNPELLEGEDNG